MNLNTKENEAHTFLEFGQGPPLGHRTYTIRDFQAYVSYLCRDQSLLIPQQLRRISIWSRSGLRTASCNTFEVCSSQLAKAGNRSSLLRLKFCYPPKKWCQN